MLISSFITLNHPDGKAMHIIGFVLLNCRRYYCCSLSVVVMNTGNKSCTTPDQSTSDIHRLVINFTENFALCAGTEKSVKFSEVFITMHTICNVLNVILLIPCSNVIEFSEH